MVPVVGVDHAPTTVFATELSPGSPISLPVSGLIPVQLDSASGRRLDIDTPPAVSDHTVHTIIVADYWSFSTCLWPPIDRYCPHCLMP